MRIIKAFLIIACFMVAPIFSDPSSIGVTLIRPAAPNQKVYFQLNQFPKNQEIVCVIERPLLGKKEQLLKFKIDEAGKVVKTGDQKEEQLELSTEQFFKGEKVTAIFQTLDSQLSAAISFIPRELICTIPGKNLSVSAELLMIKSMTNYKLKLKGLQKNEKFIFSSRSSKEHGRLELTYDMLTDGMMAYSPDVIGEPGGIAEIRFITNQATLLLRLPWGFRLSD